MTIDFEGLDRNVKVFFMPPVWYCDQPNKPVK
jgi:hypothetical protein